MQSTGVPPCYTLKTQEVSVAALFTSIAPLRALSSPNSLRIDVAQRADHVEGPYKVPKGQCDNTFVRQTKLIKEERVPTQPIIIFFQVPTIHGTGIFTLI